MISQYNIVGNILFSQSLLQIRQQLESLRKDRFDAYDRIVITQDIVDEYRYVDGVGTKLIEIQQIINQVDISNCFILLRTANTDIASEIDFVTRFYSVDPMPMGFLIEAGNYQKTIRSYKNTACRKLWDHLYVGTDGNVNPCCVADHRFPLGNISDMGANNRITDNASQIRMDMLRGYRNRACAACYDKEDQGLQSVRQVCDPLQQTVQIQELDIRLNNVCNFKCRMCSEYFSSAIQQETIELYGKDAVLGFEPVSLGKIDKTERYHRLDKILPFVSKDIKRIYFAGGEPLITGEHHVILDQLIACGNNDLEIKYNTNLSKLSYKQKNVLDKWCQFSNVTVGASIDASGPVAEYMRHGTIWQEIVTNINAIKQNTPHVKLQIDSVVSCVTVENLIDLQTEWIDKQLFCVDDFRVQVLTSPNFLSPAVLPQHHKQRLSVRIQNHIQRFSGTGLAKQWTDVLHWMNNTDYAFALKDFSHRIKVLDSHRQESFETIFPEYKDLL